MPKIRQIRNSGSPDFQPRIAKEVFVELLHNATNSVEFIFDNTTYSRKIDGVATYGVTAWPCFGQHLCWVL